MDRELHVLHAGCVRQQMADSATRFRESNPGIDIRLKPGGSVDCIRRLLAGERCDVLLSADDAIIQSMLMPDHADGYRIFAGNGIAVMATKEGKTISDQTFVQVLSDQKTTFGHFDPFIDPGGYRAVMACMLADSVKQGLSRTLLDHPGRVVLKSGNETFPEYMFTYQSAAKKSGRPYASLPEEMNLSRDELNPLYRTAFFDLADGRVYGSAISHALVIPFCAADKELAKRFAQEFLYTDFAAEGFLAKSRVVGKDPLD